MVYMVFTSATSMNILVDVHLLALSVPKKIPNLNRTWNLLVDTPHTCMVWCELYSSTSIYLQATYRRKRELVFGPSIQVQINNQAAEAPLRPLRPPAPTHW